MTTEISSTLAALQKAQSAFDSNTASATLAQPWSQELVKFLAISVLAFSSVALVISAVLLWRARASASQVLRVIGVIAILTFSALLLVVGYDNQQLTPIVGLFGAISGYLLGKETHSVDSKSG